jgi:hypothetical protein
VLLRTDGDGVIAIGQASHAWVSGQLARAWRTPIEPFEEVCLAAEQHDVGMAEWDLRPTLNPDTGLPHSFLELPLATHIALWTAAPAKLLTQSRYAALLVSMHGTALQGLRDLNRLGAADRELVLAYIRGQNQLQAELAEQLGADADEVSRNQKLVWWWDSISLALCLRWPSLKIGGYELTQDEDGATVKPWPFHGQQLDLHCEGRALDGRCETEPQLHEALERAALVRLDFMLQE